MTAVKIYDPTPSHPRYRLVWKENGRRRMRSVEGKEEARRQALEIEVKLRLGTSTSKTTGLTTRSVWDKYIAEIALTVSTEYIKQLRRFAKSDIRPLMALKINKLTTHHIQKILDAKSTYGAKKTAISRLRPFLRWAHAEPHHYLETSPQSLLEGLNYGRRNIETEQRGTQTTLRFFTPAEVLAIARATTNLWQNPIYAKKSPSTNRIQRFCHTTALMTLLIANTGLRLGEAKAIETRDIQKRGPIPTRITIQRQVREYAGGGREISRPKTGRTRTVFIPRWTAPVQNDDLSGEYTTAAQILEKFGAPSTTQTYAEFLEYKLKWLEEHLSEDFPNIKITPPVDLYENIPDVVAEIINFDIGTCICDLGDGETVTLRQLQIRHTTETPTNGRLWNDFGNDGGILPLQELVMWHMEIIAQENHREGNLWINHPEKEQVNPHSLLLWPALRPPRKNTPIPQGQEFAGLPHNGSWVPQQVTRDFVRHAIEAAGIFEIPPKGQTRRTFRELRHSFAVAALHQGIPIDIISTQLGHADTATTLKRYVGNTGSPEKAQPFSL